MDFVESPFEKIHMLWYITSYKIPTLGIPISQHFIQIVTNGNLCLKSSILMLEKCNLRQILHNEIRDSSSSSTCKLGDSILIILSKMRYQSISKENRT